jgi:hypothetical protein
MLPPKPDIINQISDDKIGKTKPREEENRRTSNLRSLRLKTSENH